MLDIAEDSPDIVTASDDYASRFKGEAGAWFLKIQEDAVLRMLPPFKGASILDVGGGHAQIARPLVEKGYRVTVHGSDSSCSRRIHDLLSQGRCQFKTGPILSLPFEDRSFDIVVSCRLLSHVENWKKLISEFSRIARLAVVVDFPTLRSFNALTSRLFGLKKRLEGNTRSFISFHEKDISAAFEIFGFRKADRFAQFFLPMVGHRILHSARGSSFLEAPFRWTGLTAWLGSPLIVKFVRNS